MTRGRMNPDISVSLCSFSTGSSCQTMFLAWPLWTCSACCCSAHGPLMCVPRCVPVGTWAAPTRPRDTCQTACKLNLVSLNLSHDQILDLDGQLTACTHLRFLDLPHNRLSHLPGSLPCSLWELHASSNRLKSLSKNDTVHQWNMRLLDLSANRLGARHLHQQHTDQSEPAEPEPQSLLDCAHQLACQFEDRRSVPQLPLPGLARLSGSAPQACSLASAR